VTSELTEAASGAPTAAKKIEKRSAQTPKSTRRWQAINATERKARVGLTAAGARSSRIGRSSNQHHPRAQRISDKECRTSRFPQITTPAGFRPYLEIAAERDGGC
jgi:hypothetical protein